MPGRSRDGEERSLEVTLEKNMVSWAWMLAPVSKWQRWQWKAQRALNNSVLGHARWTPRELGS